MINGTRLKEALIFQKSYVENSLWKTASKMVQIQRSLNLLRVDEIINWHLACEGKLHDSQGSIRRIGEIIDTKLVSAHKALTSIGEYEVQLGDIRSARKATEERVIKMKRELNESSRSNLEKMKTAPEIVALKETLNDLNEQLKVTTDNYAKARQSHPTIMAKFEEDRAFQYLFTRGYGTKEYKAGWLIRALDSWLADRIDFFHAANIYQSAVVIDKNMDDFLSVYAVKRDDLQDKLQMAEDSIQQEMDGHRFAFSELVNSIQEFETEANAKQQKLQQAKKLVMDLIRGKDEDYAKANEELIRLLIREKAAATVRLSKGQNPDIIAQRDKALSVGKDRLTVSVEAENTHRIAHTQAHRVAVIEELLSKLENRQWLTAESYFDIDERSQFFMDIVFQKADVDDAWERLKRAYLPGDAAFAIQEKEFALIA